MNMHIASETTRTGLVILFLSLLIFPVSAAVYAANGTEITSDFILIQMRGDPSLTSGILQPGEVIFFTNSHCGVCQDAKEFLDEFSLSHSKMTLETCDLFDNTENWEIFSAYKQRYHRDHLSTPSVMVGNLTLEGSNDIQNYLGEVLSLQQDTET